MTFSKLCLSALVVLFFSSSTFAQEKPKVEFLNAGDAGLQLPFSEAVKVDGQLILSGQIGISSETNELVKGGFSAETKQTLENIKTTLERYHYKMEDVVKCTAILTDISKFPEFNKIYKEAFSHPYPARTTFAVDSLVLNAQIEIECMAAK